MTAASCLEERAALLAVYPPPFFPMPPRADNTSVTPSLPHLDAAATPGECGGWSATASPRDCRGGVANTTLRSLRSR